VNALSYDIVPRRIRPCPLSSQVEIRRSRSLFATHQGLPRTARETPRSTSDRRSEVLRRDYGEARTRHRGVEPGHHGRPGYSYMAAVSARFQRIPLAPRYFRGRRFSAPRWRRIVSRGPNLYPGFSQGAPAVMHWGSAAILKILLHLSLIVPRLKADLRRYRAFSLLFVSSPLCSADRPNRSVSRGCLCKCTRQTESWRDRILQKETLGRQSLMILSGHDSVVSGCGFAGLCGLQFQVRCWRLEVGG
jgi:hypothetical protein